MSKRTVRISRRALRRVALILCLPLILIGLAYLGRSQTPRDAGGQPLLLSPSLKATLEYRAQARRWVARFHDLDADLETLLTTQRDIYTQTETTNDLLERALGLAQEIEIARAPAALAGLRDLLARTSLVYLDAVRAAADWVGAPTPENEQRVFEVLDQARALLTQVAGSRWLQEPQMQAPGDAEEPAPGAPEGGEWWTP